MCKAKKIAESLKNVLEHPLMQKIQDRTQDIMTVVDEVLSWWRYDIQTRKPGPAYVDDQFVGTDLDLACFLFELAERHAVINIPTYKGMRARTQKTDQQIVSSENRHGHILGLRANKETFSFSLTVKDVNVISETEVGAYRNFAVTDLNGNWYDGFDVLEFVPNAEENKFLFDNNIVTSDKIVFTNFVHPNRWGSLFGHHYFITKALIDRLKEESAYYFQELKVMRENGVKFPAKESSGKSEYTKTLGQKIQIDSFCVELDYPDNNSVYPQYPYDEVNLIKLTDRRNYFLYHLIPQLNFAVRTVEFAYYKYGNERIPAWLQNVKWENGYIAKGKRTAWDRLILFQPVVGQIGVSLRKRVFKSSQEVSEGYTTEPTGEKLGFVVAISQH